MTDCPGSCNAWWRGLTTAEQEASEAQPWQGDPTWCHRCKALIRRTPADLDTLAAILEHATDGHGEAPEQPGPRHNSHPPSPSPNFDITDEIERMLMAWQAEYCRIRGWATPLRHGRYASVSYEVATWLTRNMDGILESPFAYEFGDEALTAVRQLAAKAKAGSGHKRGVPPCPRCQLKMLISTDGGLVFWCAQCGRPVRKDEYDELCRAATPAARRAS